MYIQLITYGIVASMILMGGAWAQTAVLNADSEAPTGDSGAAPVTGLFDGLSPGNRLIAKSLFDAQQIDGGDSALTLDHIALSKQDGTGWGNIFKQMKEEGLVPEKNLGQAVSGQGRTGPIAGGPANDTKIRPATVGGFRRALRSEVVVTTANGSQVAVGLRNPGRRSRSLAKYSGARAGAATAKSMKVNARRAVKAGTGGRLLPAGVTVRRAAIGGASRGGGGKGGKIK